MKTPKEDPDYQVDYRSGDEASDSDKEFDSIVEIDQMLKDFTEGSLHEDEIPPKTLQLFNKLYELRELIEFDS